MRAPQLPAATRGALLLGVAVLLGIAPFGTVACSPDPERVPPLVVLVSLDTVRADELSCYGGPEGASPVLDAFAAVATRYERCISTAPWTLPSHASMFTGLFPSEHGAHSFLPQDGYRGDNVFALHPSYETLAEALGARGYRCGAFVANSIYLRPGLGLEAGFDPWDVRRNRAEVLTGRALEWLDGVGAGERPAFLFLNYLDAHRPYRTGDPEDRARARLDELIEAVMVEGGEPGALGRDVAALHQKAVTLLDAELARLFDGLKERGLFDRAVVVVTADHGEAFGAHGVVEHSKDVYEDLVRVPLVVKESRQTEGAVRTELASAVDVPGLVAAALAGTDAASAAAVFPRLPGTHPVIAENHFSRIKDVSRFGDRFRRVRRALYDGDAKVVVGSDGSLELYELEGDPGELTDLAGSQPARAASLAQELARWMEAHRRKGEPALPADLTPSQRRDLGALGYGPSAEDGGDASKER